MKKGLEVFYGEFVDVLVGVWVMDRVVGCICS